MPLSSATRALVQAMLEPGEQIRYLLPAVLPGRSAGQVFVAVTSRSITVFSAGARGVAQPTSVLARYPRRTRVGPPDLHGVPTFTLAGVRYQVGDEYLAVISALNLEQTRSDALPRDPLPDL